MKTISWMSYRQALSVLESNPEVYVISVGCKYGSDHDDIAKVRKKAKHLYPINIGLDELGKGEFAGIGEFLMSIPEDGELIVHCNEGRFRSRYIVEAIRDTWADVFEEHVSLGKVLGIEGRMNRADFWDHVRPMRETFTNQLERLKDAHDGKVESSEAEGSTGA